MAVIRVMTFKIHGSDPEWDNLHTEPTPGHFDDILQTSSDSRKK